MTKRKPSEELLNKKNAGDATFTVTVTAIDHRVPLNEIKLTLSTSSTIEV